MEETWRKLQRKGWKISELFEEFMGNLEKDEGEIEENRRRIEEN
jgi:hypothetical protein